MPLSVRRETRLIETPVRSVEITESRGSCTETIYYGPCFVCERESRYTGFTHEYDADDWLKKQFRPKLRERHLQTLRTGKPEVYGQYVLSTLEGFLCPTCKAECRESRQRILREAKEAEDRQRRAEIRTRWLSTWRQPEPNEFDRTTLRRVFSVYSREGRIASLLFRARVAPNVLCRGNSPAHRVGLWADGRLLAHYYGWELPQLESAHYPDRGRPSDLFGPGLARWVEGQFQSVLVTLEPDATWTARAPICGRRSDADWNGWDRVCDIGMDGPLQPALIHTIGSDHSSYASLRNFYTSSEVADFAFRNLHIDIREGWMIDKTR